MPETKFIQLTRPNGAFVVINVSRILAVNTADEFANLDPTLTLADADGARSVLALRSGATVVDKNTVIMPEFVAVQETVHDVSRILGASS